jgi:hypothetical protein
MFPRTSLKAYSTASYRIPTSPCSLEDHPIKSPMLTVRFLYSLPILTPPLPARSLLSLLWNQAEPSDPIPEYWDHCQLDAMRGSLWFKRLRVAYDGCGMQTNRPISPVMIPEGWTIQRQVSYLLPWVQRVLYLASGCKHSSPRSLSRRTEQMMLSRCLQSVSFDWELIRNSDLRLQFFACACKEYLCLAEGPFLGEIGETGSISKPLRSFGTDSLRTEVHPDGRFAYTGLRNQQTQQGYGM